MDTRDSPRAIVTGASSGIGFELARCCADNGYSLQIVADEPEIESAAQRLRADGSTVEALQADLSTPQGVEQLHSAIGDRSVAALLANAARGLGRAFLEQSFEEIRRAIDTNVTGTMDLIQRAGKRVRDRRARRISIVGSIAGFRPGMSRAVYNMEPRHFWIGLAEQTPRSDLQHPAVGRARRATWPFGTLVAGESARRDPQPTGVAQ